MADGVDQPGDAPEAVQTATRQIGDVRDATKRYQMMWTDTVDGDAADDHHVGAMIFKALAERIRRIEIVTPEQATLPEFAYALRCPSHVRRIWGNATGTEQVTDGLLKGGRVEGILSRDTNSRWCVLVFAAV